MAAAKQHLYELYPVGPDVKDLSKEHAPISKEFGTPQPHSKAEFDKYRLSDEQVKYFNDHGYVLGVPVLNEEQVEMLRKELQTFAHPETVKGMGLFHEFHANESGDPNKVLMHCLGHWRITPGFHDLVFHPAISVACSQLLGDVPVRFWHDQLFAKPAHFGGCVSWHQDYSYWIRTVPMAHLTVHIALDDQVVENGCLHYIPGSHKWNDKPLPITDLHFGDMDSIKTVLTEDQKNQFKPVPMLLKKGQACFHHALTIHGSFSNKSDGPRRAAVVNVFADGTQSAADVPLLDGVPVFPNGTKLEGQFFPLLHDPARV